MSEEKDKDENKLKESFCPVCIAAIPLAFSLSTGTAATVLDEEQRVMKKRIIFWSTIISILSSVILIAIYWKCEKCA